MSEPKSYTFTYSFSYIPPVMLRGTHALIVVQDTEGKYLLGSKHIYPPDIYRLLGGGIDAHEEPVVGACRELTEELGIVIPPKKMSHIATITAHVSDPRRSATFVTYLFHTNIGSQEVTPADDIDGVVRYSQKELNDLIARFYSLSDEPVTFEKKYGDMPNTQFSWKDYGTFYGKVHEIALTLTSS